MDEINLISPDNRVRGSFAFAGEIRWGPVYYNLRLPLYDFGERLFGQEHLWSTDSRCLAVQEWLTTDYADGPFTELLLIDFLSVRQCPLSKADKGFIVPIRFESALLIYRKDFKGRGESREYEIAFESLEQWTPIPRLRRNVEK